MKGTDMGKTFCNCGGVEWRYANLLYGPEGDGWCLRVGEEYGHALYTNVSYCPWCGYCLREIPKPTLPEEE